VCFDHSNRAYHELFVNLDVQKRVNLSVVTLPCECQFDRRSDMLLPLAADPLGENHTSFVGRIDDYTLALSRTLFFNINSIGVPTTHEAQSAANMSAVDRIYRRPGSPARTAHGRESGSRTSRTAPSTSPAASVAR